MLDLELLLKHNEGLSQVFINEKEQAKMLLLKNFKGFC